MYSPETLGAMNQRICEKVAADKAAKAARLERAKQRTPSQGLPVGFVSGFSPKSASL